MIHECSVCRKREHWSGSWMWYGSINDLDGGDPRKPWPKNPARAIKTCSDECRGRAVDLGLILADAPIIDEIDEARR